MKIAYETWNPSPSVRVEIDRADQVCGEYALQGYDLTLRQLYYQFVARGWIPNTIQSYKRIGDIVNKARLAGLLDWDHIVDRTRNLRSLGHWDDPSDIMRSAASSFRLDKWDDQPRRVEVWVEKEALAGVIERVADEYDVPWFSCRGYVSQSELWGAAMRLSRYIRNGQDVTILHLGDHDPSGLDMTRDIRDRLNLFLRHHHGRVGDRVEVRRIALNFDQVQDHNPPPNPAKTTDSRAAAYIEQYGHESWELDALDPATLASLIGENINDCRDWELWDAQHTAEFRHRELLTAASDRWSEVADLVGAS